MKRLIVLSLFASLLAIGAIKQLRTCDSAPPARPDAPTRFSMPEPPAPPAPPAPMLVEESDEPRGPRRVVKRLVISYGRRGEHAGHAEGHAHGRAAGPGGPAMATCCFDGDPGEPEPGVVRVAGELMADPERALADLRRATRERVVEWLAVAGVPRDWQTPEPLVAALVRGAPELEAEERDYGIDGLMHRASVELDLSRANKGRLVGEYHRQTSARRLVQLGGGLAFVLATLAVYAGYVRSDEATRGYYTNRLRLLAAGAVGAAGVVLYQMAA